MNSKMDPMGRAIADYHKNKKASKLRVFSPMFEEDEIPLTALFRSYKSMPEIERKALDMAKGRALDVGAGSGCHSLVLQEKGIDVTAIDISPLSVETMKERGVKKVFEQDFFTLEGKYDTILMLMNGIGIVGTLERLPEFFRQFDKIEVNGENEHPLYTWLKAQKGFGGFDVNDQRGKMMDGMLRKQDADYDKKTDIKWNFTKFLVSRDGRVLKRYEPTDKMTDVEADVQMELNTAQSDSKPSSSMP